jgi:hypothetical protein
MPTTDARPHQRRPRSGKQPRSWRHRCRTAWAGALTGLLGSLFVGLTVMTLILWGSEPTYAQTNPVVDLAFFALGGVLVTTGFASQIRTPSIAGLQQAVLALVALSVAGGLGGRIEPFVGPLVLLVAVVPLVALHPDRRRLLTPGPAVSRALMVMAVVGAVPATAYAVDMLGRAQAAGPSCFLGQCVRGDRYAEAAALALAVVLVALLASTRTPGWMLPAWTAGIAAVVLGAASLLWSGEVGALGGAWAVSTVAWGFAVILIASVHHLQARRVVHHHAGGRTIRREPEAGEPRGTTGKRQQ